MPALAGGGHSGHFYLFATYSHGLRFYQQRQRPSARDCERPACSVGSTSSGSKCHRHCYPPS